MITDFHRTIRTCIRADWLRTQLDKVLDQGPDIPLKRCLRPWTRAEFAAQWLGEGIWFHLTPPVGRDGQDLTVNLSLASPVPAHPYTQVS